MRSIPSHPCFAFALTFLCPAPPPGPRAKGPVSGTGTSRAPAEELSEKQPCPCTSLSHSPLSALQLTGAPPPRGSSPQSSASTSPLPSAHHLLAQGRSPPLPHAPLLPPFASLRFPAPTECSIPHSSMWTGSHFTWLGPRGNLTSSGPLAPVLALAPHFPSPGHCRSGGVSPLSLEDSSQPVSHTYRDTFQGLGSSWEPWVQLRSDEAGLWGASPP